MAINQYTHGPRLSTRVGKVLPDEKVYFERSGQEIDVYKDGTVALEAVGEAQVIARAGGVEGRLTIEITEPKGK